MAEIGKIEIILSLFVLIVIGVLFADILADTTQQTGSTHTVVNQSIGFTGRVGLMGYPAVRDLNNIITAGIAVSNSTNNSVGSNNFATSTNGTIILLDPNFCNNGVAGTCSRNVSYSFFDELYVRDGTSRVFIGLLVLLFVIGLFVLVVVKAMNNDFFSFE